MKHVDRNGWRLVRFGDVVREINDWDKEMAYTNFTRCVRGEDIDTDEVKIRRWGNVPEDMAPTFGKIFRAGQVLYHTRSPNLRKYSQVFFDGYCGEKVVVLETKDESILMQDLIPYILQSEHHFQYALRTASGSTNKFTSWKKISAYEFLLPPPEQQRELVKLMQGFEKAIEAGEETLGSIVKLRERMLTAHFTDEASSSEWESTGLEPLCEKITSGGTPNRSRAEYFIGEIPWVKTGELKDDYLYDTEEHISEEAVQNSSAKVFPVNTVLVAMYGATIGQTAILARPMATNQACCAFIADETKLNFKYLHYLLLHNKEKLISMGIGAGQPNISQKVIKSLQFKIPKVEDQLRIVQLLLSADVTFEKQKSKLEAERQLRFSILNTALSPSARAEAAAEVTA